MEQEKAYEDLMTIRSFMEEGRRRFKDNGFYFIYWGLVIPLNTAISYLLGYIGKENWIGWFWMLSSIVHGLITAFISYRNGKKSKSRNFSQNLMGKLWIAILIIMPIFFLQQSFLDQFNLNLLLSNICLILALSTWVHAWLIDLKWILWVPIGWLLCSVGIFFIPEFYSPILVALATFGFDFIPGIILKRSKEK